MVTPTTFVPAPAGWALIARPDRRTGQPDPAAHYAVGHLLGWLIPHSRYSSKRITVAAFPGHTGALAAPVNLDPDQIVQTSATWEALWKHLRHCCADCEARIAAKEATP